MRLYLIHVEMLEIIKQLTMMEKKIMKNKLVKKQIIKTLI